MNLYQIFVDGGFIMYPLLLCSLVIWAVVLEKVYSFRKFEKLAAQYNHQTLKLLQQNKVEEAKGLLATAPDLIKKPYLSIFEKDGTDLFTRQLLRVLDRTQRKLKKSLWVLGTIGSSAPFIGLFGTVVGIIKSFHAISVTGKSGFSVVAAGLSEALIATAAGILVAVIAIIFYNYLQVRLKEIWSLFKNHVEELHDNFKTT